jgi:hypothetical protein
MPKSYKCLIIVGNFEQRKIYLSFFADLFADLFAGQQNKQGNLCEILRHDHAVYIQRGHAVGAQTNFTEAWRSISTRYIYRVEMLRVHKLCSVIVRGHHPLGHSTA